jgi:hypothetical protein
MKNDLIKQLYSQIKEQQILLKELIKTATTEHSDFIKAKIEAKRRPISLSTSRRNDL